MKIMKKKNKNLISISGRIGSGKDLLGKIFQVLLDKPRAFDKLDVITEEDVNYAVFDQPTFEIKKFANKLKDMVCILLDCTREQLEDREFKEKELGKEWWVFKFPNNQISTYKKDVPDFWQKYLVKLTPRLLLQLLGTQCGRDILHPNIWCTSLFVTYKPHLGIKHKLAGEEVDENYEPHEEDIIDVYPNWIITDTRFPNEFEAVKSRGGICIKIEREVKNINGMCKDKCDNFPDCKPCGDIKPLHESETALDNQTFDSEIYNNGSIKELVEIAKKFLKDYGYIK